MAQIDGLRLLSVRMDNGELIGPTLQAKINGMWMDVPQVECKQYESRSFGHFEVKEGRWEVAD